jgi:hypothetical protein
MKETVKQIIDTFVDRVRLWLRTREWGEDGEADLQILDIKWRSWLSEARKKTSEELDAAVDGWIDVAGRKTLASEVRLLQDYCDAAAANDLAKSNDKQRCLTGNDERMWTPSLFPKLDYDEWRKKDVITADGKRRMSGYCTAKDWTNWEEINLDNDRHQDEAREKRKKAYRACMNAFRRFHDCKTTDDVAHKFGWKSPKT